jgi:hypothetical protein
MHRRIKLDKEGTMNRVVLTMAAVAFVLGALNGSMGADLRIYNDGDIDYVPLEASFVLTAEDTESSVGEIRFSINGASPRVYDGPITLDSEGRHVIAYWAVDMAGNVSNEKIYSVVVDATAPQGFVSIHGPALMDEEEIFLTASSNIVIWAEDDLSGVDAIHVSLDGGSYVLYTEPVAITDEGYHTASAYAVDNVGNRTEEFSVAGYVDSTPPVVSVSARNNFVAVAGKNYTNKTNEFVVSANDEYSGVGEVLVSLDGSEYVAYSGPFKVQIRGEHTIRAKAVDRLGNESTPVELNFYVDISPPNTSMGVELED